MMRKDRKVKSLQSLLCAWILMLGAQNVTAQIKKRRIFILPKYTSSYRQPDKKLFENQVNELEKNGIAIYRTGQKYSVLIPHDIVFSEGSDNVLKSGEGVTKILASWLKTYNIQQLKYTGVFTDKGNQEFARELVRKQTAKLIKILNKTEDIASISTVTTKKIQSKKELPFWQNMRLMRDKKTVHNVGTIIEFDMSTQY